MNKEIVIKNINSGDLFRFIPPIVIGRGEESDLSLPDPAISHRHLLVTSTDNTQILIQDLDSANGVYVDQKRIQGKVFLNSGDSIWLGRTELQLSCVEKETSSQTVILHSLSSAEVKSPDQERLKVIYEITGELAVSHDVFSLGNKIFLKLKEVFKLDRGYIATFQEDGSLKPLCLCSIEESAPLSKSIINRVLQSGESLLMADALGDDALNTQESVMKLKIRSALCVPLIYNNQIYGLIYLDRNIPGAYRNEDLEFLKSIGHIIAPLIENARLWSELNSRYEDAIKTLRKTETRLIETERTAAYVRLSHAMAHEIRNPFMILGAKVRKILRSNPDMSDSDSFKAIMDSVRRVEQVLKEVDSFVSIPPPQKKLEKIDKIIRDEMENSHEEWEKNSLSYSLTLNTSYLMVPLDAGLFRKAIQMVLSEIIFNASKGTEINITIRDSENELEVVFGDLEKEASLRELFDPEIGKKPWSLGLFLNIANKILSDHGGKLLMDPRASSAFPVILRLPRTQKI